MRGSYAKITALGGDVVAVGTGQSWYARAFVEEEQIPFLVLLDEDGEAAEAAAVRRASLGELVGPRVAVAATRAFASGHRQRKSGKRPYQLGATFVVGPGDAVHYEHVDANAGDHAPVADVLAVVERVGAA